MARFAPCLVHPARARPFRHRELQRDDRCRAGGGARHRRSSSTATSGAPAGGGARRAGPTATGRPTRSAAAIRSAHDFLPRHRAHGRTISSSTSSATPACHDYMWPLPHAPSGPGRPPRPRRCTTRGPRALLPAEPGGRLSRRAARGRIPTPPPGVADWVVAGVGNMAAALAADRATSSARRARSPCTSPRRRRDCAKRTPARTSLVVRHGTPDLQTPGAPAQKRRTAAEAQSAAGAGPRHLRGVRAGHAREAHPADSAGAGGDSGVAPHVRLQLVGDVASHYDVHADAERARRRPTSSRSPAS